jgi:hypothetical protein
MYQREFPTLLTKMNCAECDLASLLEHLADLAKKTDPVPGSVDAAARAAFRWNRAREHGEPQQPAGEPQEPAGEPQEPASDERDDDEESD